MMLLQNPCAFNCPTGQDHIAAYPDERYLMRKLNYEVKAGIILRMFFFIYIFLCIM